MYDSLNLRKAKHKIRSVIIVALLVSVVLLIPMYFVLRPIYVNVSGGDFIWEYLSCGSYCLLCWRCSTGFAFGMY